MAKNKSDVGRERTIRRDGSGGENIDIMRETYEKCKPYSCSRTCIPILVCPWDKLICFGDRRREARKAGWQAKCDYLSGCLPFTEFIAATEARARSEAQA